MVEKCWYERRMDETGIPFLSIKNGTDTSELVFNPNNYYLALLGAVILYGEKDESTVTPAVLLAICKQCQLCTPEIYEDKVGFRIKRKNYLYLETGPLFQTTVIEPKGEPKNVKVAIIDDTDGAQLLGDGLSEYGYQAMAVKVNPNIKPTIIAESQLTEIILGWNPDLLISDKGLGFVDGINLILRCKEEGIRTIMLTGEVQTNETRKVADIFLKKPVFTKDVIHCINTFYGSTLQA